MDRRIAHFDLDSFFVSVECLRDPSLLGKPVVVGGSSERGVVASCSYEARKFGVHSAMPGKLAKQLCPNAIFVKGNMDLYSEYSRRVTKIMESCSPIVEKASIDEHYIDLSGMDKFIKESLLWTKELRQKIIKETGLPISFGLSTNKTVSKMATNEAKPNGEKYIEPGMEKAFLAPLSIRKIPGIGSKTYVVLSNMGIEKIESIQKMTKEAMYTALGENGESIWRKANGINNSPVIPFHEQKSISTETTFHKDTGDAEKLKNVLTGMVDELAFSLRKIKKVSACVTIKLRYANFETHTFQTHMPYTAADHILLRKALELFRKNYSGKPLIRLIGVRLSDLVSGLSQIDLFDDTEEMVNLYQAMDKIRKRYGDRAITRAASVKPIVKELRMGKD
jgi:DNA polymerase IV